MSTYGEVQRRERRRAIRMLIAVVSATAIAITLFVVAIGRAPKKLKTGKYRATEQPAAANRPGPSSVPSLGAGLEVDIDPDAALRRRLVKLDYDDERMVRRLLEAYRAVGAEADFAQVARFCDALERAFTEDERIEVKRAVLGVFVRIPPSLLLSDPFGPRLIAEDAELRRLAVEGIARHGRNERYRELLPLAKDPVASVRRAVATALKGLRSAEVQAVLLDLLHDADDDVVAATAEPLAMSLGTELPPRFLEACRSQRVAQRLAAAEAVAAVRGPLAPAILSGFARDPDWRIRRTAIQGLGSLRGEAATPATRALEDIAFDASLARTDRFEALQALAALPSLGRPEELARVAKSDEDPVLRLVAARACLAHKDVSVVPALTALLTVQMGPRCDEEDQEFVQATAAETLREALALDEEATAESLPSLAERAVARLDPSSLDYSPVRIWEFW